MIFPTRLSEVRKLKKLSTKDMASILNISIRTYQRYEQGTREPKYDTLLIISNYLDVSLDYLFGRTDNPEINRWRACTD